IARLRLLHRHTKAVKFIRAIPPADAEIEPAFRKHIYRGCLLGEQRRVVPGQHHYRGTQTKRRGLCCNVSEGVARSTDLARAGNVMLNYKSTLKATPFGCLPVIKEVR